MIRWDLGVPMGLRTKVIAMVPLGVVFRSTEPAFVSDKVYGRESPGLTLFRPTRSAPRSGEPAAPSVAAPPRETKGPNLTEPLSWNTAATPHLTPPAPGA